MSKLRVSARYQEYYIQMEREELQQFGYHLDTQKNLTLEELFSPEEVFEIRFLDLELAVLAELADDSEYCALLGIPPDQCANILTEWNYSVGEFV